MTIYGFSGKPRSGKSYTVVENCIIPALKQGRVVYHNMQLRQAALEAVCEVPPGTFSSRLVQFDRECSPDDLVDGAPAGALVVIDESLRYWPVGVKANKVPKNQLEFFTMHGHNVGPDGRTTDIVLICQDFGSQCASFIRELIEVNYYAVKLRAVGLSKRYRLEVYQGVVKGDQPSQKRLIRKTFKRYSPEVYGCYVSHTNAAKGVAGEELDDASATIWKSWPVLAAGVAIIVAGVCIYGVVHFFQTFGSRRGGCACSGT